jgi:hypothetical protein
MKRITGITAIALVLVMPAGILATAATSASATLQKVASGHASGDAAIASASGTANDPSGIFVSVTSTPPQKGLVSWTMDCTENSGGVGSKSGQNTVNIPVVETLALPGPSNHGSCDVSANVQLSGSGTVTITIEQAVNSTTAPTVTTAAPTGSVHIVAAFPNDVTITNSTGGYVLYSNGRVNAVQGAPFYGDARKSGLNNFVTMAQDPLNGYWLITSAGQIYAYGGKICAGPPGVVGPKNVVGPIVGTIYPANSNAEGFTMVNAAGTLYSYSCPD